MRGIVAEQRAHRRLAAILAADVAEYSRLMHADEAGTIAAWQEARRSAIDPTLEAHNGRVVKRTGDGFLAEFATVEEAVRCAVAMQAALSDGPLQFRLGINLGDITDDGDDIHGDGVNIAARLEGLAEPGGICISGGVHDQIHNKLTLAFEDLGERTVKNIGDPVRAYLIRAQATPVAWPKPTDAPSLPDKPSIVVLPFENMSADTEQEYFSDGISEDIITELSKISGLFVIARHSAFAYKGRSVTLRQVGRELGVKFVLEGSVRKAGRRLRITAQLIDAATDHHLWAERYDRDIDDIFAVQDEVARHVARTLAVALEPGELERLAHVLTQNMEAYDLYLRARTRAWPPSRGNIQSAQFAFARVIDLDPKFAGGYAGKSIAHSLNVMFGHSDGPEKEAQLALELAERAVALDGKFARSHSALGTAYTASRRHVKAIAAARRAIELQPGDADSYAFCARCLMFSGSGEEAAGMVRTALRLDPQYVEGPYLNLLGRVLFVAGHYTDCIDAYERNRDRGGPSTGFGSLGLFSWISACGHTGQKEAAQNLIRELQRQRSHFSLEEILDHPEALCEGELEPLVDGLRKAGWEG